MATLSFAVTVKVPSPVSTRMSFTSAGSTERISASLARYWVLSNSPMSPPRTTLNVASTGRGLKPGSTRGCAVEIRAFFTRLVALGAATGAASDEPPSSTARSAASTASSSSSTPSSTFSSASASPGPVAQSLSATAAAKATEYSSSAILSSSLTDSSSSSSTCDRASPRAARASRSATRSLALATRASAKSAWSAGAAPAPRYDTAGDPTREGSCLMPAFALPPFTVPAFALLAFLLLAFTTDGSEHEMNIKLKVAPGPFGLLMIAASASVTRVASYLPAASIAHVAVRALLPLATSTMTLDGCNLTTSATFSPKLISSKLADASSTHRNSTRVA